jgi:homoserine kinase type II
VGRFTELTDEQIATLADEFGFGEVKSWKALDAGTINSNFEVLAGQRFFLRINEDKSEDEVAFEARLVRELAERGVNTPLPWTTKDEQPYARLGDKLVSAFLWVEGEHRELLDVGMSDVELVGEELGRLHLAGLKTDDRYKRPGRYTFDQIVSRYQSFAESDDGELADAIAAIGDEITWLTERRAERDAAPRGVIHGDLFRDNVIFHDQGVSLIDFEQASWGSLVYDLAVCVNAWCFGKKRFNKHLVKELVAGYQKSRPLTDPEKPLLYVEARAAAMRFTVTRITDVYLPATGQEDKDFRRYLKRLEELREVGADEFAGWTGAM